MVTINTKDILHISDAAKENGYEVGIRDIALVILLEYFKEPEIAYSAVYGKNGTKSEMVQYTKGGKIKFVKGYMDANYPSLWESRRGKKKEDISFEENKAYMLQLKSRTEAAIQNSEITKKDGLKILADLSIKLNDKFQVTNNSMEQRVVVYPKFNHVCEFTKKECWLQTKEFAMEHWNLVERPDEHQQKEEEDDIKTED